jgi:hypothetical protein
MWGQDMNVLDVVLVVVALGIAALTFTQPPVAVLADIIALYAATVLAGALYKPVAKLPLLGFLPGANTVTMQLWVFVVLLIGGALVLRTLLRQLLGMMTLSGRTSGSLLGGLLSAALAIILALVTVLVIVLALLAIAQMPSTVGIVTFVRNQLANSSLIPHLDQAMKIYLRCVSVFFPNGLPAVFPAIS